MGIKTVITLSQLPLKYQKYKLIPTTNGVMATVYLLDDIYVLKLFEKRSSSIAIDSEIELLNSVNNLPIPEIVDRFKIGDDEVIIYTQIKGKIVFNPNINEITEIGKFLKKFHQQSSKIELKNEPLFTQKRLKILIESTQNQTLLNHYHNISLTLNRDGVIHGDLFPDNCKFIDTKLSGVYDFSDACIGDFYFDLAVVVVGFCFNNNILDRKKVNALLISYDSNIDKNLFDNYIRYALLYYATTRFISNLNSYELIRRLELFVFPIC